MQAKFKLSTVATALMAMYAPSHAAEDLSEVEQYTRPDSSISVGVGNMSGNRQNFGRYDGVTGNDTHLILDADVRKRDEASGTWMTFNARNLGLDNREFGASYEQQGNWGAMLDYSRILSENPLKFITGARGIGSTSITYGGVGTGASASAATTNAAANLFPANREEQLETHRDLTTLNVYKFLTQNLSFNLSFKNEDKKGERLWGRGSNPEFAAEPIDSTTRQFKAIFNYASEIYQMSGGLTGSWYSNHNSFVDTLGGSQTRVTTVAGLANTSAGHTFLSLPLDNQAYQLFLNGGYNFTKSTRGTFKAAYTRATQDESLSPISNALIASGATGTNTYIPFAGAPSSLNGRVDTKLLELGLTSKPISKLSLVANLRYQERDDKTPMRNFGDYWSFRCTGSGTTNFYTGSQPTTGAACAPFGGAGTITAANQSHVEIENNPRDFKNLAGKLEATYRLPDGYSLTGGLNYDKRERSFEIDPTAGEYEGVVKMRGQTEETALNLKLRRALSDTVNGTLAYQHAKRDGSTWHIAEGAAFANHPINYVNPAPFADRKRDKWRLALDWDPTSAMSFQFNYETANDDYSAGKSGLKDGRQETISFDGSFVLNKDWKLGAWASHDTNKMRQTGYTYDTRTTVGVSSGTSTNVNWCSTTAPIALGAGCVAGPDLIWDAHLKDTGNSLGLNLRGKAMAKLQVGADLQWTSNKSEYPINSNVPTYNTTVAGAGGVANTASQNLPDINTKIFRLAIFGEYELEKNADIRFDFVHQRFKTDDWTWREWNAAGTALVPFTYMDGTTVHTKLKQTANFIGARYIYKFQ